MEVVVFLQARSQALVQLVLANGGLPPIHGRLQNFINAEHSASFSTRGFAKAGRLTLWRPPYKIFFLNLTHYCISTLQAKNFSSSLHATKG
jgi:hypothetical protein